MGRGLGHKLLATFDDRPLVLAALEAALAAGLEETVVVWGALDLRPLLPAGATALENPHWRGGLATSLAVGLRWCAARDHDAAVVGLGDAPLVPADAWRAVASSSSDVAVATFSGQPHPPVRLAREVWGSLPSEGDVGARALWSCGVLEVDWVPCPGDSADVDTPSDLRRALGSLAQGSQSS